MNQATVEHVQKTYQISGVVDFITAPELMSRASEYFKGAGQAAIKHTAEPAEKIDIDLLQITECNSAGLSLMLEMVNVARNNKLEIQFINMPDTLMTIAKAYGIENEIRDICK